MPGHSRAPRQPADSAPMRHTAAADGRYCRFITSQLNNLISLKRSHMIARHGCLTVSAAVRSHPVSRTGEGPACPSAAGDTGRLPDRTARAAPGQPGARWPGGPDPAGVHRVIRDHGVSHPARNQPYPGGPGSDHLPAVNRPRDGPSAARGGRVAGPGSGRTHRIRDESIAGWIHRCRSTTPPGLRWRCWHRSRPGTTPTGHR
jgi:hypothetical protein